MLLYNSLDKIKNRFYYYLTSCRVLLLKLLPDDFLIYKVVVAGNKFTDEREILSLVDEKQSIMDIQLSKLSDTIQSASKWIKSVRIYRILPTKTLYIDVDEHVPFALWKDNNRISVIDFEGKVIINDYIIDNLIIIKGRNSLSNLKLIRDILEKKSQLSEHITSCIYIENRRWNIILDNNYTIKLPEDDPYSAWSYLNHLQNATDFTFNKWSIIDMRTSNKIFVEK